MGMGILRPEFPTLPRDITSSLEVKIPKAEKCRDFGEFPRSSPGVTMNDPKTTRENDVELGFWTHGELKGPNMDEVAPGYSTTALENSPQPMRIVSEDADMGAKIFVPRVGSENHPRKSADRLGAEFGIKNAVPPGLPSFGESGGKGGAEMSKLPPTRSEGDVRAEISGGSSGLELSWDFPGTPTPSPGTPRPAKSTLDVEIATKVSSPKIGRGSPPFPKGSSGVNIPAALRGIGGPTMGQAVDFSRVMGRRPLDLNPPSSTIGSQSHTQLYSQSELQNCQLYIERAPAGGRGSFGEFIPLLVSMDESGPPLETNPPKQQKGAKKGGGWKAKVKKGWP